MGLLAIGDIATVFTPLFFLNIKNKPFECFFIEKLHFNDSRSHIFIVQSSDPVINVFPFY
jgi:hypothetical protein